MQWTIRKRFSQSLTGDFNFTYGKSLDLASSSENAGSFSGLLQNPWSRDLQWAVSNYDRTFIANAFAVWQVPIGRKRKFLANASRPVDAILGGWEISPTFQKASGTPVSVGNCRCWPTNWNITPNAQVLGPVTTSPTKNAPSVAGTGGANLFPDPNVALKSYTNPLPGEAGQRNVLRRQGPFVINTLVAKTFTLFTVARQPARAAVPLGVVQPDQYHTFQQRCRSTSETRGLSESNAASTPSIHWISGIQERSASTALHPTPVRCSSRYVTCFRRLLWQALGSASHYTRSSRRTTRVSITHPCHDWRLCGDEGLTRTSKPPLDRRAML